MEWRRGALELRSMNCEKIFALWRESGTNLDEVYTCTDGSKQTEGPLYRVSIARSAEVASDPADTAERGKVHRRDLASGHYWPQGLCGLMASAILACVNSEKQRPDTFESV